MNDNFDSPSQPPILEPAQIVLAQEAMAVSSSSSAPHILSYMVTWSVIFAVVAFHAVLGTFKETDERTEATKVDLLQVSIMGKLAVGARAMTEQQAFPFQVKEFGRDDFPESHWGEAIILNEVQGPKVALDHLKKIEGSISQAGLSLTSDQNRLVGILTRLFTNYGRGDYVAAEVNDGDREFLRQRMGWLGTLAITPKEGADRSARSKLEQSAVAFIVIAFGIGLLFIVALFGGFVGLLVAIVALLSKTPRLRFESNYGTSHIYGETFAVWFVGFTVLQIIVGASVTQKFHLMGAGAAFFVSLLALLWPIIRGLQWSDVRDAIGWRSKSSVFAEGFIGFISYVCMAPLIFVAVLFTALLTEVFTAHGLIGFMQLEGKNAPSHPIVFELAKNEPITLVTALFLACIAAPIIEETMFRGVLYRHLRDSTVWFKRFLSVVISAGLNSLIFAAIHPQGLVGIPVLGTLAFGFSIVREWRGSLIAPMVMHAVNNGTMTLLFLLVIHNL